MINALKILGLAAILVLPGAFAILVAVALYKQAKVRSLR